MKRVFLCFALLLFFFPHPLRAQLSKSTLTVILLPGTTLTDWQNANAPLLHARMAAGSLAVMNTRTARIPPGQARETSESAILTLWAGARALDSRTTAGLGYTINLRNLDDALASKHIGQSQFRVVTANLATIDSVLRLAKGRILLLSPFVNDTDYFAGRRLAPVLVFGADVPAGLIFSPSTRRAGLVTNTDFAPTVAAFFDAELPTRPFGAVWTFRPAPDAVDAVAKLDETAVRQASDMRILPYVAVFLAGVILLAAWRFPWLAPLAPAIILLLIVSPTPPWSLFVGVFICLAPRWVIPTLFVVLTGDLLLGNPLMKSGLLGYSAIEGARYYGIGNEAMGVLVGAGLATASRWKRPQWEILTLLSFVTALVGLPQFGAKAGGIVVCVFAFGAWGMETSGVKIRARHVLILTLTALGILTLALLTDAGNSHFGQLVSRVKTSGIGEFWDIATRKLAVEGRLLTHSAWAVLLAAAAFGLARQKAKSSAWAAILACLAFNDAGVVAAALCGTVLWSNQKFLDFPPPAADGIDGPAR